MTERERFEAHYKHLDKTLSRDAWDREIYAHSHVEALWSGWQAAIESRVLAERKPIYQVRPVGQLKWSDIEPVSLSMYQDAERYQTRIVFTHPTPDDADSEDA